MAICDGSLIVLAPQVCSYTVRKMKNDMYLPYMYSTYHHNVFLRQKRSLPRHLPLGFPESIEAQSRGHNPSVPQSL